MRFFILVVLSLAAISMAAFAQIRVTPPVSVTTEINLDPQMEKYCYISEVAAFENRVHLRCRAGGRPGVVTPPDNSANGRYAQSIFYFAVDARAQQDLASRVVELGSAALAQDRDLLIAFRSAPSENPPGCLPQDCRRLVGVVMLGSNRAYTRTPSRQDG